MMSLLRQLMKYVLMYTCILASQVAQVVKIPPVNAGDQRDGGSSPGSGRSPGGGHGIPPHCSHLENPMDRGAWQATVHGIARVRHDLVTKPLPPTVFILMKLTIPDNWNMSVGRDE